MKITLGTKILSITFACALALIAMAVAILFQFGKVSNSIRDIEITGQGMVNHLRIDVLNDDLYTDVLLLLYATELNDTPEVDNRLKLLETHTQEMAQRTQRNTQLKFSNDVDSALELTYEPLKNFVKIVHDIKNTALSSPKAALDMKPSLVNSFNILEDALALATKKVEAYTQQVAANEIEASNNFLKTLWATVVIALIGIGILSFFVIRSVPKPFQTLAAGISDLVNSFTSAANNLSASSQSLAQGATEQAASLEETSASLEEMSSMIQRTSDNAQTASVLANETSSAAKASKQDVNDMNQAMAAIKASSDNIAKILKTIDEIAFQTNILALNAAVEAARAGTAGAGFAVVADEVRNLAQRSAQAAQETAQKIQDAIQKTEIGVKSAQRVSEQLSDILTKAEKTNTLISEIATASQEQSEGIHQSTTAVAQIDQVTQSNAANAEENAAAALEVHSQTEFLKQAVEDLLIMAAARRTHQHAYSSASQPLAQHSLFAQEAQQHGHEGSLSFNPHSETYKEEHSNHIPVLSTHNGGIKGRDRGPWKSTNTESN